MGTKRPKHRPKLTRIDVVYRADICGEPWKVLVDGRVVAMWGLKRMAEGDARSMGREFGDDYLHGQRKTGATVRVQRKRDRRWQAEWTYPRRLDPRRSKG
jgi:hypothetical protein